MKYTCTACGYVYDEEAEGESFQNLPADWECAKCGAPKEAFEILEDTDEEDEDYEDEFGE